MRFGVPRSTSPSPVRRSRRRSTYGLPSDSSSEDEDSSSDEEEAQSSSASESDHAPVVLKRESLSRPSVAEMRYIEDAMTSVRLRAKHYDPYEEWEKETKQDSFRAARIAQSKIKGERHEGQLSAHVEAAKRLALLHNKQLADVQSIRALIEQRQREEENKLRQRWEERRNIVHARVDRVLELENQRVRALQEAEHKKREEAERRRREEEERLRKDEEERQREEEERRKREEERKRKMEAEAEERRNTLELEMQRRKQEEAQQEQLKVLGMAGIMDEWRRARVSLKELKAGPMKTVKSDRSLKSVWSAGRRAITPKVGQLTNDTQAISQISQQLIAILCPTPPHPRPVYIALLSSLAKSILLQAETEVTALPRSAVPLAAVLASLLASPALSDFSEVFWAKLCQRAGGWPVPMVIPVTDVDGQQFSPEERKKALGYRKSASGDDGEMESLAEYVTRVSGVMRVYFETMKAETQAPLEGIWRTQRIWTWLARMLGQERLLQSAVGASLIHVALDVLGVHARDIWGQQWVKLLEILYEGTTQGIYGKTGKLIGGTSSEGTAARTRVQLEIQRILSGS